MVCMHCESMCAKRPTYQVLKVDQKILDSHWVRGYFKKGHKITKANRKHRWIRTAAVPLPPFRKFAKMVEEGEKFVEGNK